LIGNSASRLLRDRGHLDNMIHTVAILWLPRGRFAKVLIDMGSSWVIKKTYVGTAGPVFDLWLGVADDDEARTSSLTRDVFSVFTLRRVAILPVFLILLG